MERFSNNYADLIAEVDNELRSLNLNDDEERIVYYSELPWFPGGQFSISLIKSIPENKYKLLVKEWDAIYDCNRFSTGVFNPDRLCIHEKMIELTESQRVGIEKALSIEKYPDIKEPQNQIILDGIDYTLNINTGNLRQEYKWKIAPDSMQVFTPLINYIIKLSGI